jgi:AraC-like DNA-binding protein
LALGIDDNRKEAKSVHSIHKAVEFIQEHYAMNVRLSQVARQAGMSLSCFVRSFKQNVGVPFTTYLNIVRTTKAQEMIKENNLSMSATAFACGFRNQFHFTRTFKKFTGTTPSDFRKSIKKHSNLHVNQ